MLVVLLGATGATAQTGNESTSASAADTTETPAPGIAIAEIPQNLDSSNRFLREHLSELETSAADTTVAEALRAERPVLDDLMARPAALDPAGVSARASRAGCPEAAITSSPRANL